MWLKVQSQGQSKSEQPLWAAWVLTVLSPPDPPPRFPQTGPPAPQGPWGGQRRKQKGSQIPVERAL